MAFTIGSLIYSGSIFSVIIYLLTRFSVKLGSIFTTVLFGLYVYAIYILKDSVSISFIHLPGAYNLTFKADLFNWPFLMIGTIVLFVSALFSIHGLKSFKSAASFNFLSVLVGTSVLGVFGANDLLTLFIFWELMTWASFFLVSMGKKEARSAALFFLFMSMISAYLMIYGMFLVYNKVGSFSLDVIANNWGDLSDIRGRLFVLFVLAGLIKGGVWPVHVWLRTTHGNAPNIFSSVLSGILIKFGSFIVYLFVVFFPAFYLTTKGVSSVGAEKLSHPILAYIGAISIMIGTLSAIRQNDFKKLIAFSSVSHAGYIVLGIAFGTGSAILGGLSHIWVHALTAAGMFLSAAAVYYVTGTTNMDEMGGLVRKMPITFTTYLVAIISVAGIPPLAGFVSKWLIYQALIAKGNYLLTFIAFFGSVGSFLYVFRPLATVFLGQLPHKYDSVKEVPWSMQLSMLIVTILTIVFGVFPSFMLKPIIRIEEALSIPTVKIEGYSNIYTMLTQLDMFLVAIIFGIGFIFVTILFFLLAKSTKVEQYEQYTAGEIVQEISTTPEIYHYSKNYYRSFERVIEWAPSLEEYYRIAARHISRFYDILDGIIFKSGIPMYVWFITITILVLLLIRW